jgi:hypothetical protein
MASSLCSRSVYETKWIKNTESWCFILHFWCIVHQCNWGYWSPGFPGDLPGINSMVKAVQYTGDNWFRLLSMCVDGHCLITSVYPLYRCSVCIGPYFLDVTVPVCSIVGTSWQPFLDWQQCPCSVREFSSESIALFFSAVNIVAAVVWIVQLVVQSKDSVWDFYLWCILFYLTNYVIILTSSWFAANLICLCRHRCDDFSFIQVYKIVKICLYVFNHYHLGPSVIDGNINKDTDIPLYFY